MAGTQPNTLREAPAFRSARPWVWLPAVHPGLRLPAGVFEENRMAHGNKSTQAVTLEELAVSTAFEVAALIAVLERKGILTHAEVLDEITRQKKGHPRGR